MLHECNSCLKEAKEVLKYETNTPAGDKLMNLIDTSIKDFNKFLERNKIDLADLKNRSERNGDS